MWSPTSAVAPRQPWRPTPPPPPRPRRRTTLVAVVRLEQQAARAQESLLANVGRQRRGDVPKRADAGLPAPRLQLLPQLALDLAVDPRRLADIVGGHFDRDHLPIPLEGQRAREVALARADVDDDVAARLARDAVAQLGEAHDLVHLLRLDRRPQRRRHVPLLRAPSVRVGARAWRRRAGAALRRRARARRAGRAAAARARQRRRHAARAAARGVADVGPMQERRERAKIGRELVDRRVPRRRKAIPQCVGKKSFTRPCESSCATSPRRKATTSVARWRAAASSNERRRLQGVLPRRPMCSSAAHEDCSSVLNPARCGASDGCRETAALVENPHDHDASLRHGTGFTATTSARRSVTRRGW